MNEDGITDSDSLESMVQEFYMGLFKEDDRTRNITLRQKRFPSISVDFHRMLKKPMS